jgi:hypothetical protein
MDNTNVDSAILANMGDGLQSLIQNTPAASATAADIIPGTNLNDGPALAPGGVGQAGNIAPTGGGGLVTPQTPGPAMTPEQVAHLQQVAYNATQERIDLEEQLFESQLAASDLTEVEKQLVRTQRELDQTQQVNGWLNRQQQQVMTSQEMQAKSLYGLTLAHQTGLPFDNPGVKQALMAANSSQEMRQIAASLAQAINVNQRQQVAGQVQAGIFQAGGNTGGVPQATQPKQHSGDLGGLIRSRPTTVVNWG